MKTIRTITLSMMLMVPATMMWADNINEDKAKSMAQGFLQTNTRVRTAAANKPLKLAAQSTGYYAYNIGQGNGYVIVATDDNVENTILGYSDKGTFDTTRMPDNMRWWLTEYDRQVEEASKLSKEQLRSMRTRRMATGSGIHRNQSAADHQVEPGRTVQRPLPRGRLWAEKHDGMRGNGNGAGDELPQMAKDRNRQQLLRLV